MLELNQVVRHYRGAAEDVRAVDGVSLVVGRGEMVAVHGPSGSGKTTLLMLIASLLKPDQGVVRYRGCDLSSLSDSQLSDYLLRDVGFVRQGRRLMPKVPAVDNASIKLMQGGLPMRKARPRAVPWLERVGLGDRLDHTPEQLSGGERQRVAIAGVLAGEPRLILADEPTANLDSARSIEIVELLREMARESAAAVVLVTHDTEAAALADWCCTLRDGKLLGERPGGEQDHLLASQPHSSGARG